MWLLASRLTQAGFEVHNLDYPSTEETIDQLVEMLDGEVEQCCLGSEKTLHFVTHSLGGILVRAYISQERPDNLGRVVMLSPPNQGSQLVDELRDSPLFQWATGPAGQELGTDPSNLPNRLGPADFEVGIITGSRSLNPLTSWLVSGEDDGKVSVESAQLEGMADFLVVPNTHTFIMNSTQVAEEVVHFLEQGAFSEP
jgi:alpha-beta hydrolase superfamily lysophospholipase